MGGPVDIHVRPDLWNFYQINKNLDVSQFVDELTTFHYLFSVFQQD